MNLYSLIIALHLLGNISVGRDRAQSVSLPVNNPLITSAFGPRTDPISGRTRNHLGVDLRAAEGTAIRAIGKGRVVFAGTFEGYGKLIVIRHGPHLTSHYAHCENEVVRVGDFVRAGMRIGAIGSTGRTTGPHLHFELRIDGRAIDPVLAFPGLRQTGVRNVR